MFQLQISTSLAVPLLFTITSCLKRGKNNLQIKHKTLTEVCVRDMANIDPGGRPFFQRRRIFFFLFRFFLTSRFNLKIVKASVSVHTFIDNVVWRFLALASSFHFGLYVPSFCHCGRRLLFICVDIKSVQNEICFSLPFFPPPPFMIVDIPFFNKFFS